MGVVRQSASRFGRVMSRAKRVIRRLARMSLREWATMFHVVVVLVVVEATVRSVRLPRLAELLGFRMDLGPSGTSSPQMMPTELSDTEQRQLRSAYLVASVWPFAQGPCLRRSLVVGHLLRRRDPALRLGMAGVDGNLEAHAWIEIDHRPLEDVAAYTHFGTGLSA